MKNLLLLSICLGITFALQAQQDTEKSLTAKGISATPARFTLQVEGVDDRFVRKVWKNYTRMMFDARTKYDRKQEEYLTEEAQLSNLGSQPVDLTAEIQDYGSTVEFSLLVDQQGDYLSVTENYREVQEVRAIMEDFELEIERELIRHRLDDEEQELRRIDRQLRKLQNAQKRYYYEIEAAEERIARMKAKIEENKTEQVETSARLEQQKALLQQVQDMLAEVGG